MIDPTSDVGKVDPESAPVCAACGDRVLGVEHRVVTWVENGQIEHRHFCDTECRDAWEDERD